MKFLKLALVFICVLVLVGLSQLANAAENAKSIDELAARYDVSSCKGCHPETFSQWEKSAHAKSMFGLGGRTAATFMTTIERGLKTFPYSGVKGPGDVKVKHLVFCTKCHLPQLDEATDEVAQEIIMAIYTLRDPESVEKIEKLNINCLVCHQKKAITHKWLDGPVEKNAVYGSKDGAHPYGKYPIMKKGPILHESILCGQCHGLGPNLEFEEPSQCATAYGSYLFAYIPEGGHETCQNCHMEKLKKGHAISSYRDMDMAKAALEFNVVDVYSYHWRKNKEEGVIPLAVAKVEMTNKTGHGVPDG